MCPRKQRTFFSRWQKGKAKGEVREIQRLEGPLPGRRCREPGEKEWEWLLGVETRLDDQQGDPQSYHHTEQDSAANLNDPGSRFFP